MTKNSNDCADYFLYLPVMEEDYDMCLSCTTCGSVRTPPFVPYPQYKDRHPQVFTTVKEYRILHEFQLVYIAEGDGVFQVGNVSHNVHPGSVMLLLPGIKHAYSPLPESGWHEYWVGFKGCLPKLLEKEILRAPNFFENVLGDRICGIFRQIIDEAKEQRPLYQIKASAHILLLFSEIFAKENHGEQTSFYDGIVEKAKLFMEANIYGSINLPDIYRQLGISASHLNQIFRACTGETPYQYYINAKIQKAKTLLLCSDMEVKEVAYKTGFDDQYYFSRLFRAKTGFSPTQWRKAGR